jgi:hypothetical protein
MSEAKASPIMTNLTTMSAFMNMPHGDRSCGSNGLDGAAAHAAAGIIAAANAVADNEPLRDVQWVILRFNIVETDPIKLRECECDSTVRCGGLLNEC